jgi:predicted nucleotidyltransferase
MQALEDVVRSNGSIDAAALYGSVARGDVENHSDVDLLLVCQNQRKLPVIESIQTELGSLFERLSVAVYSHRELSFLHSVRSLFLLHLSREAVVINDRSGFLRGLLAGFEPKNSYHADFDKSLALMDPLRMQVRDAPNNFHRLSYIYSLFRVFGVYLLAERGIYEFSKSRMVNLLCLNFPDAVQGVGTLSGLRVLNSSFFTSGGLGSENEAAYPTGSLPHYAGALQCVAGVPLFVSEVSYEDAVSSFLLASERQNRGLDYRLRVWFLLLVYDGLNLYCKSAGREPLVGFRNERLKELRDSDAPSAVKTAARDTIEFIRRYPLKYFLKEEERISPIRARRILEDICLELTV